MMEDASCRRIMEGVLRHRKAGEIEVLVEYEDRALTRFANNCIHQNVSEENVTVSVRVIDGKRSARVTSNRTDDAALKRAVERASEAAKFIPPAELPEGVLKDAQYRTVPRYAEDVDALGPAGRARAAGEAIDLAGAKGLNAAGLVQARRTAVGFGNSAGLYALHKQTEVEFSVTMDTGESTGWACFVCPSAQELDAARHAETAARKAIEGRGALDIEPGDYTVILEHHAMAELLGFLFYGDGISSFSQSAVDEERSYLSGKTGSRLFGDNVNIFDDAYHPLQTGMPFDGEGVPRKKLVLVEQGVVKQTTSSRAYALKIGTEPTGHGLPPPSPYDSFPLNVVFEGGGATIDDMVASTRKGILVTRLWYTRLVEPSSVTVTGMTRDGAFYIEDGRVSRPVKNLRYNVSMVKMLNNIEMLGPASRSTEGFLGWMVVPAAKVREFHFSSGTVF